ncbi:hypothetical protein Psyaliredsea_21000 [Psychrobacter alimentarius]
MFSIFKSYVDAAVRYSDISLRKHIAEKHELQRSGQWNCLSSQYSPNYTKINLYNKGVDNGMSTITIFS